MTNYERITNPSLEDTAKDRIIYHKKSLNIGIGGLEILTELLIQNQKHLKKKSSG